jgi:hypothetical protein
MTVSARLHDRRQSWHEPVSCPSEMVQPLLRRLLVQRSCSARRR